MHRMSSPNCLSLALNHHYLFLKTYLWVKAYNCKIYSPVKIRFYILVLSPLSSAIPFWDLIAALTSAEGLNFSELSLPTWIRSESEGSVKLLSELEERGEKWKPASQNWNRKVNEYFSIPFLSSVII